MAVSIGATRGRKKEQIYRSMTVSTGVTRGRKKEQTLYDSRYWCNQGQEKGTDL